MIYSIQQHKEVPVEISKTFTHLPKFGDFTRYTVNDASKRKINIGYVDLKDTNNGVEVMYIKNLQPNLYKYFGKIADQIELEHCMQRGIDTPYIQSDAMVGTLMQHYIRGKRYINEGINVYLGHICENLQKGERVFTGFLGTQKMYMPINMINEIKEKIKIAPLLKNICK